MTRCLPLVILLAGLGPLPLRADSEDAQAPDEFGQKATLKAVEAGEIHRQVLSWLAERNVPDSVRGQVESLWQAADEATPDERLELLAQSLALGDERARSLVALCARPRTKGPLAPQEWLRTGDAPLLERNNLRLVYARWLSHYGLYDEMLEQIQDLQPTDVVDPASLLFYQSVAHHRLLHKDPGLAALKRLLTDVADCPKRYRSVAVLMQDDLERLEDESLDHIARLMDDVRRRLGLGRAGQKVVKTEDDVIAALDKLIKRVEEQQQQQQQRQGQGGANGSARPSQPMQDSRPAALKGPGDVNRRDVGHSAGWGDLPPKDREEALQQIGKDFPSHYRDAIEQYFRKLASESETD